MGQLEEIIKYIQNNPEVESTEIRKVYCSSDQKLARKLIINPKVDGPFGFMTSLTVYPKKGLYSPENLSDFTLKLIPPGVKPYRINDLSVRDSSNYNELMTFYEGRGLIFLEELGKVITSTNEIMEGEELIRLFGNKGGFYQGKREETILTNYTHELDVYPRLSREELKEFEIQFYKRMNKFTRENFQDILSGKKSKNVTYPEKRK